MKFQPRPRFGALGVRGRAHFSVQSGVFGAKAPLVERSGVHELLVPLAHQRVQVVSGVLLPELAQHLLLVPWLDAHDGLCLSQNSMVFRVSSSSKRSARESCLMALIVAGVGSGLSGSGSSAAATGAGTGAAACSGATSGNPWRALEALEPPGMAWKRLETPHMHG